MGEENKQSEIRLLDLWSILKRCWWLMLIVAVVITIGVYAFQKTNHESEYTSELTILAVKTNDGNSTGVSSDYYNVIIASQLVETYKQLFSHYEVLDRVIADRNLPINADDLEKMISVSSNSDTSIIQISVTTKSQDTAQEITNAWGEIGTEFVNEKFGDTRVTMVGHALKPTTESNPISLLKIMLIAFVCALVVYAVYFVRFILDDKINNTEDVEKYLGLNVLGSIPNKHQTGRKRSKYGYYYSYTADGGKQRL